MKKERLPILVTSGDEELLLYVLLLKRSTGLNIGTAVVEQIQNWNLQENVKAMCYDTTACNSGVKNGAAFFVEKLLRKSYLRLCCRHHICEIVLEAVFTDLIGPEIKIFQRFRESW